MSLSKEEVLEIADLVGTLAGEAEAFKPVIKEVLGAVASYGPELEEIPKKLTRWIVQNRIESIKQYRDAGFSKKEAILLTIDSKTAMSDFLSNMNKKAK